MALDALHAVEVALSRVVCLIDVDGRATMVGDVVLVDGRGGVDGEADGGVGVEAQDVGQQEAQHRRVVFVAGDEVVHVFLTAYKPLLMLRRVAEEVGDDGVQVGLRAVFVASGGLQRALGDETPRKGAADVQDVRDGAGTE